MTDLQARFSEISNLMRERQAKEADLRDLDRRIFALLGVPVTFEDRKPKPLSPAAMRAACGLS